MLDLDLSHVYCLLQHAYFYAHAKRETGEEPAPLPVHVPLEVVPVALPAEIFEPIVSGFQFLDEGKAVKVGGPEP